MMPKQVIVSSVSYLFPAVTKTCNPGLAEAMIEDDELDFSDGEGAMSKHTFTWTVTAVRLGHTHARIFAKDVQQLERNDRTLHMHMFKQVSLGTSVQYLQHDQARLALAT